MPDDKPETGQVRSAIDSGKTGDKVTVQDPAAAPFYTDAETSGQPTRRGWARYSARLQEIWATPYQKHATHEDHKNAMLDFGFIAALVVIGIIAGLMSLPA